MSEIIMDEPYIILCQGGINIVVPPGINPEGKGAFDNNQANVDLFPIK
ncbi:hypothetical protein [Aneurinibacillus tyrosinisolvens]|nr:hypothetical protein [Aneurinibacillus tyrosinisolvens]